MNQPPYIVVDELESVTAAVKLKLSLPVLNYQYGYVSELRETLGQMNDPAFAGLKYPLIWLAQPFTIDAGKLPQMYGKIDELRIFIIGESVKTYKASERMTSVFKPVLYPIFNELVNQIALSKNFLIYQAQMNYKVTDRYYWGDEKPIVNDVVDIMEARFFNIIIQNNLNCLPVLVL